MENQRRKREGQDKNKKRLDLLLRNHRGALVRKATALLGSDARAEDAVQEACLRVMKTETPYDPSRNRAGDTEAGYKSWFMQVIAHICIDWQRAGLRRPEVNLSALPPGMLELRGGTSVLNADEFKLSGYAIDICGQTLDAWKYLQPDERWILEQVYFKEREEMEIADTGCASTAVTGQVVMKRMTEGAVRSRLMNARHSLRAAVRRARLDALAAESESIQRDDLPEAY